MNDLLRHRGPDGAGVWTHPHRGVGFGHRRLNIIDAQGGAQPMTNGRGTWLTYNGEVYNYRELRDEIGRDQFSTRSDTEVVLRAYDEWGDECVTRLRGMFAFALWDDARQRLFCARDRFGIKPFHYAEVDGVLYIASEVKALLPFLPAVETDTQALDEYLTFQCCIGGRTLFKGVSTLPPGHVMTVANGRVAIRQYVDVCEPPGDGSEREAAADAPEIELRARLRESVALHLRSDVPVGVYISGGIDSAIVAALAQEAGRDIVGFTGRFDAGPAYDESAYASAVAAHCGVDLHTETIRVGDFVDDIRRVIFHLDYPVAGPGAFAQFMMAKAVGRQRSVVLGGQGGDELFGGYVRYLIASLERSLKAAVEGTAADTAFSLASILPNLDALDGYAPLLGEFWSEGLFGPSDLRYFRLIDRTAGRSIERSPWRGAGERAPIEVFRAIFNDGPAGVSYFDRMLRFDVRTLLPALLHVEDRMSMAHGVESRVPFVDIEVAALAAGTPAAVKCPGGRLKYLLRRAFAAEVPAAVLARRDKMGFPTPVVEFCRGAARDFVHDVFGTTAARTRPFIDNRRVVERLEVEPQFGRAFWGHLSLELWQQEFHDRSAWYKQLARDAAPVPYGCEQMESRV